MNTINKGQDRRTFMKVSTLAGGGMMLGVSWLTACKPEQQQIIAKAMPTQWHEANAYIKIGDTGLITIMSPNPEIGQNVKTSMPMIIAEELDVAWEDVVVEQAPFNSEWYTRQVAGGSQSIRKGWDSLRKAGATIRHMLIEAAAQQWEVDVADCYTEKGIIKTETGKSIGYGDIAAALVDMEVPEEVPFKALRDYTIIGQDKRNVDLDNIVTGKPLFGIDTRKEGMKYACMMRPPAFGQELASYDDSAAKAVNGVEQVLQIDNKIAVVARNTWAAMKGKKALVAQWKDNSDLENSVDHDTELLALLDKNADKPLRKDGDLEKAFAEAEFVLDRTFEAPFLPHNCMEPMNFFADLQGDKVSMTGPIQTPQWTQGRVAGKVEVKPEDVSIMMTRMGGGFGRRLYGDFAEESAQISKAAGVPIQLVFSREDDMTAGTYRPASKYRIQASVKEGNVTGYKLTEVCVNGNMYDLIPNFFPAAAIENYEVHAHALESKITTGAWRAPYTNFLGFAEQSFIDELAHKMEVDAVQLRLDLLENAKNNIDDKIEYSPERMQAVIKLAAEKSGWGNADSGVYQGFSAYYSHNTHVAEVAEVVMEDDMPIVKKVICAVDCGIVINPIAARNQIQGGVIDGIGHAMYGDLTFENGRPSAQNFNKYRLIRMAEAPVVEVHFVENNLSPTGLGEPSLPPAGGAIANAIHAATGKRVYKQPFIKHYDVIG